MPENDAVGQLSHEQVCKLATKARRGDIDARNRIVAANLRLVKAVAKGYAGRGLGMQDLIGEGYLGLIEAVERFDPDLGYRFATYAYQKIRSAITMAIYDTGSVIRLPHHALKLMRRWRTAQNRLRQELGREPEGREIAESLGLSDEQRGMAEKAINARAIRVEATGGGDRTYRDCGESELADEWAKVEARMRSLKPRDREILSLRFGLGDEGPLPLHEIGRRLGITREWVRRSQDNSIEKLGKIPIGDPRCRS